MITNSGDNPLTNLSVSLSVTGANTFSDIQTINLATGASTIVNFASFTPASTGTNTITVTIPADDILTNNSKTLTQDVNTNILAYSNYDPAISSVGFNTGTGILASKYSVNGSSGVLGINAFIYTTPNIAGNTLTGVVLDNAGTIVGTSAPYVVSTGDLGTYVNFPITVPPVVANQDFYVGILQSANATGYFPIGVQAEPLPARPNAYYSFLPAGGAATNYVNLGRVMIDAVMSVFPLATDDLNLTAKSKQNDIQLDWTSINDQVNYFEIERSANGKEFHPINRTMAEINKPGAKEYRFIDKDAMNLNVPTFYYRVKQVEVNGSVNYSPLASVKVKGERPLSMTISNPVSERIQMKLLSPEGGPVTIAIADMQGRIVYTQETYLAAGASLITLDGCDRLAAGSYSVTLTDGKVALTQKFIQQ